MTNSSAPAADAPEPGGFSALDADGLPEEAVAATSGDAPQATAPSKQAGDSHDKNRLETMPFIRTPHGEHVGVTSLRRVRRRVLCDPTMAAVGKIVRENHELAIIERAMAARLAQ